jgi:hypothetical protein
LRIERRNNRLENFSPLPFLGVVEKNVVPWTRDKLDPFVLESGPGAGGFLNMTGHPSPEVCKQKDIFAECSQDRSLIEYSPKTAIDIPCFRGNHIVCHGSD